MRPRPAASPARPCSSAAPASSRGSPSRRDGRLPLIGVGGVATAEDALTKIEAGATAVQLYTALVYGGITLAARLPRALDALARNARNTTAAEAVGSGRGRWL